MYPVHCKRAVPFGIALRIKRNCSTDDFLQNRCKEYKAYLKSQNYPAELVDKQFDKALSIPRAELLRRKVKPAKKKNSIGPRLQSNFAGHPKSHPWLAYNKSEQVDLRSQIKYTQQQQQALIHLQF